MQGKLPSRTSASARTQHAAAGLLPGIMVVAAEWEAAVAAMTARATVAAVAASALGRAVAKGSSPPAAPVLVVHTSGASRAAVMARLEAWTAAAAAPEQARREAAVVALEEQA